MRNAALVLALGALLPMTAAAQESGEWKYSATIYGYGPSIGGSTNVPVSTGGSNLNVNYDTLLSHLKMAFLGSFEAHNGHWGVFTDILYMDLGGSKSNTRDFTPVSAGIGASTTANLDLDLKSTIWTIAGEYRIATDPALKLDLLAGARVLDFKQRLRWEFTGDIGTLPPASRSGTFEDTERAWDGIVGLKGRYALGEDKRWFVPFYLDIGTGDSELTYQAAAGVAYAFSWGEITGMWRYIDYRFKAGKSVDNLNLNGPLIGATFRW